MGRYNEVYAEIKIENKWYSLNPIVKDEKSGKYEIKPIIYGQSYLTPFFDFAREHCTHTGMPEDLSKDLYELLKPDEIISDFGEEKPRKDIYGGYFAVLDFHKLSIVVKDPNKYQYCGFVDDNDIKNYEAYSEHEITNYHSIESFILLPEKKRNRLRYFEWDDYSYGSIYPICKGLIRTINMLKDYFLDNFYGYCSYESENKEIRLIVFGE